MFQSQKTNIDIKCAVLRNCKPGGGVSWMLFCTHHPTGKIFLEFEVHHWHGGSVAVTVCDHAVNLHLEEDLARYFGNHSSTDGRRSLGFTTSSFKHFVNPCMHLMHHMLAPHASHACTSCITCFYQGCRIFKFCTSTTTVWDWDF